MYMRKETNKWDVQYLCKRVCERDNKALYRLRIKNMSKKRNLLLDANSQMFREYYVPIRLWLSPPY